MHAETHAQKLWLDRYLPVVVDDLGWQAAAAPDGKSIIIETSELDFQISNTGGRDNEFLHLWTALEVEPDMDLDLLQRALDATCNDVKLAKAFLTGTLVVCTVEMLVAGPACLPSRQALVAVLPRSLRSIEFALKNVMEQFQLLGIAQATEASLADAEAPVVNGD